jgi:hypothetical protein
MALLIKEKMALWFVWEQPNTLIPMNLRGKLEKLIFYRAGFYTYGYRLQPGGSAAGGLP